MHLLVESILMTLYESDVFRHCMQLDLLEQGYLKPVGFSWGAGGWCPKASQLRRGIVLLFQTVGNYIGNQSAMRNHFLLQCKEIEKK